MKYSIIIPAYKANNTIGLCVKSIVAQAEDTEIIIVSDDRDEAAFEELKQSVHEAVKQYDNVLIKLIRNKRTPGVSGARNTGLEQATGSYVWFVDSDDQPCDNWIEIWNEAVNLNGEVSIAGFQEIRNHRVHAERKCIGSREPISQHEFVREYLEKMQLEWLINPVWNKLFQRDFLREHHIVFPENGSMGEDLCFCLETIHNAKRVGLMPGMIYRYMNDIEEPSSCSYFHKDAIDMTFLAWQREREIYQNVGENIPETISTNYKENVEAYIADLMIDQHGTWKEMAEILTRAKSLDLVEEMNLKMLYQKYWKYKYVHFRKIASKIKHYNMKNSKTPN